MYLWHLTKIPLVDVPSDAMVCRVHVLAHKVESVRSGQKRKEFILLGLIVQYLWLWFSKKKNTDVSLMWSPLSVKAKKKKRAYI